MLFICGLVVALNALVSVSNGCNIPEYTDKTSDMTKRVSGSGAVTIRNEYFCKESQSSQFDDFITELKCPNSASSGISFDIEILDYVKSSLAEAIADWEMVIGVAGVDFVSNNRYMGYIMGTKQKAYKPSKSGYHRRANYGSGYKKGDRIRVELLANGNLIFYVNGVSLGVAYSNVFSSLGNKDVVGIIRTAAKSSFRMSGLRCNTDVSKINNDCQIGLAPYINAEGWKILKRDSAITVANEWACTNSGSSSFQDIRPNAFCGMGQGIEYELIVTDYEEPANNDDVGIVIGVANLDFISNQKYYGYVMYAKQKGYKAGTNSYFKRADYGNGYKRGDRVKVVVTKNGDLIFYVNGVSQGVAYTNVVNSLGGPGIMGVVRTRIESKLEFVKARCIK